MEKSVNLYSLSAKDYKSYLYAALFVCGNIALPQLCHLVPQGGLIFLPIYFFTLIAAYKYGIVTGLVCAIASPLANSMLFGMPHAAVLPAIMIKSVLLAISAAVIAKRCGKVSIAAIAAAVFAYQFAGFVGEWILTSDFILAIQDFRIGLPGIALQIVLGYTVLRRMK